MVDALRRRLTYANVMATIAVVVAVGTGSAYAVHEVINGSDVVDESLTGDDIEGNSPAVEGTIKGEDIKDGTINAKNIAIGGVNSLRIADETVASVDVANESLGSNEILDGSLALSDISAQARNKLVESTSSSLKTDVAHEADNTPSGQFETLALHRRLSDSGDTFFLNGWIEILCKESGMTIDYRSNEDEWSDPGHQRVWVDAGGTNGQYVVLGPGEGVTVLDTTVTGPIARHFVVRVQSLNHDASALFDVGVVRRAHSPRPDQCYWHATTWNFYSLSG